MISVTPVAADHQRMPAVPLPVAGVVLHYLFIAPPTVCFGAMPLGSSAETTLSVVVRGGGPCLIKSVNCTDPDVRIEPYDYGSSSVQVFRVRQRITRIGSRTTSIDVSANVPNSGIEHAELSLSYIGTVRGVQR